MLFINKKKKSNHSIGRPITNFLCCSLTREHDLEFVIKIKYKVIQFKIELSIHLLIKCK